MRIALLSDIHGNIDALEVCLNSVRDSGCTEFLIAGDIVGYYYDVKRDAAVLGTAKFAIYQSEVKID
jgi:hypothetical protein